MENWAGEIRGTRRIFSHLLIAETLIRETQKNGGLNQIANFEPRLSVNTFDKYSILNFIRQIETNTILLKPSYLPTINSPEKFHRGINGVCSKISAKFATEIALSLSWTFIIANMIFCKRLSLRVHQ